MQNKIIDIDKELNHFRHSMDILQKDMPISVLCLPKRIDIILQKNGLIRVYDLTAERLKKVKGLGRKSIDLILQKLDVFNT